MSDLNVVRAAWSVVWALRVRRPDPGGAGDISHDALAPTLRLLAVPGGLSTVDQDALSGYLNDLQSIDPDTLGRPGALAYWVNLYNAAAVRLAARARSLGERSVMRLPGGFDAQVVTVGGESLSLNDVEHGKIRRFGDPRIHGALVCGSVSCPTLRAVPFQGEGIDAALDDQMRAFVSRGGVTIDRAAPAVSLSRVFLWYGGDFVREHRMPSFVPVSKRAVLEAVIRWMPAGDAAWVAEARPSVSFQSYDWGVGCAITQPTDD